MKYLKKIAGGAVLSVLASAAFSESHIDPALAGAITARQAHRSLYNYNLAVLGNMAQDKTPYDAGAATAAANNLAALAALSQAGYWPQGSDSASVEGSRALPAIWETYPAIVEKAAALSDAAAALAIVAGNDLDSLKAAIGPVGAACGGCHKAFRQPG
jgi:cytochrome c556